MSARPEWKRRWEPLRASVIKRDRFLCQPCHRAGRLTEAAEVDHIVPRSQQGTNDPSNLEAICSGCHQVKSKREANPNYSERAAVDVTGAPAGW